jgi:hypothetical protein
MMYDRLLKLLSEAESEKRKAYLQGKPVRTVLPGTGGAIRTAQKGKETEVRRPASLLAPYKGKNVSGGVRTLQKVEKKHKGRNVGNIKKLP